MSEGEDNGTTTSYSYDKNNEVDCVTYPAISGSTCNNAPSSTNSVVDFAYNKSGEIDSIADWLGNTITPLNFNSLGEIGEITYPASTGVTLKYKYDADGNLTQATYSGSLISALSGSDTWTPNADTKIGASTAIGNFSSSSDTYDAYGRSSQATNPTSSGSQSGPDAYLYNANGELASDTPPGTGSQTLTYTYNNGAELTSIDNPNNSASTQYESLGYNGDGQRCGEYQSSSANNSVNCGSLPGGATGLGWNGYGQLCWVGTTTNANVGCGSPPTGSTSFGYDGNGLLTAASTPSSNLSFTWDTAGPNPLMLSDGTNSYVYGPLLFGGTAPLEEIANNTTPEFIAPTSSGVQAVFSGGSSPALLEEAAYSVYGTQVVQSGSAVTPFGFDGSYQIAGLNYLVNRYYDPSTSEFLSVDPAVAVTGEPYVFSADDPLNATDPTGQMIESVSNGNVCNGQAVNAKCGITAPVEVQGVNPNTIAPVNNPTASFLSWLSTQPPAVQSYFVTLHDLQILAAAGFPSGGVVAESSNAATSESAATSAAVDTYICLGVSGCLASYAQSLTDFESGAELAASHVPSSNQLWTAVGQLASAVGHSSIVTATCAAWGAASARGAVSYANPEVEAGAWPGWTILAFEAAGAVAGCAHIDIQDNPAG